MEFQLENLCKENKLSYLQLEKLLNISNAKLSLYARKINYPNVERAEIIANFFQCSIDYLTGLSKNKNSGNYGKISLEKFFNRIDNLFEIKKSKTKISEESGIARSTFRRLKLKKNFPKLSTLYLIAKS